MLSFSSSPLSPSLLTPPPLSSPTRHRTTIPSPRPSATATATATTYGYPLSDQTRSNQNNNNFTYLTNTSSAISALTCSSLYEILGIPVGATTQEIKTAYRKLARTFHPDVVAIDRKDSSAVDFMKIQSAYGTLSDPEKRAVYDRKLLRRNINRPRPLSFAGDNGYRGRSWETDQCW